MLLQKQCEMTASIDYYPVIYPRAGVQHTFKGPPQQLTNWSESAPQAQIEK